MLPLGDLEGTTEVGERVDFLDLLVGMNVPWVRGRECVCVCVGVGERVCVCVCVGVLVG